MSRPNFFCNVDSLKWLLENDFEGDYKDIDFTMDIIEIPLFLIFSSDEENWTVKAMQRCEIYSHDDDDETEEGRVVVNKSSGDGKITIPEESSLDMEVFFVACIRLNSYLQENNLEEIAAKLDPESEGIMLYVEDDELKYKVVSGKERPDMICMTLFGTSETKRPYVEEIIENSEIEMMSFKEKLEAAEDGDNDAMHAVATVYLDGDEDEGVEQDPVKALYWFEKAAEEGNSSSAFNAGLFYAKAYGTQRSFIKAAEWMDIAADDDDEVARSCAEEYRRLADASEKAKAGDAQAQADLAGGLMILARTLDQAGVAKDYEESVMWAKKSAAQGCPDGYWVLALAYHHGRGVDEDMDQAFELYRKGADAGSAPCRHSLGCGYIIGTDLKKDFHKGFEYIKAAAEQKYGLAMVDLGRCYQFAIGTPGNMKTAVEWYEKALEVLDDPELEHNVKVFKMIGKKDPGFGDDYPEVDEDLNLPDMGFSMQ